MRPSPHGYDASPHRTGAHPTARPHDVHGRPPRHAPRRRPPGRRAVGPRGGRHVPRPGPPALVRRLPRRAGRAPRRSRTTSGSRSCPSVCRPSPSTPTASSASTTCSTTPCGASPWHSTAWSTPRRPPAPGPPPTTPPASCPACSTSTSASRTPTCSPSTSGTSPRTSTPRWRIGPASCSSCAACRSPCRGSWARRPRPSAAASSTRAPVAMKLLWYASRRRHAAPGRPGPRPRDAGGGVMLRRLVTWSYDRRRRVLALWVAALVAAPRARRRRRRRQRGRLHRPRQRLGRGGRAAAGAVPRVRRRHGRRRLHRRRRRHRRRRDRAASTPWRPSSRDVAQRGGRRARARSPPTGRPGVLQVRFDEPGEQLPADIGRAGDGPGRRGRGRRPAGRARRLPDRDRSSSRRPAPSRSACWPRW